MIPKFLKAHFHARKFNNNNNRHQTCYVVVGAEIKNKYKKK